MNPARKEPDVSTYSGRFAVRLRTLREKKGLAVQEVADAVGVAKSTVYHWETGHVAPPVDTYPKLAETFGVKVRTLFPES